MTRFLLDTDWVIDVLHAQPHAVAELPALSRSGVSVSIVSYAELYEGAYYARDQQAALTALQTFLSDVPILPVSTAIAQRFGVIRGALPRQHRRQIGDFDLLIAATALVHGVTLVTRNQRDYLLVPSVTLQPLNETP